MALARSVRGTRRRRTRIRAERPARTSKRALATTFLPDNNLSFPAQAPAVPAQHAAVTRPTPWRTTTRCDLSRRPGKSFAGGGGGETDAVTCTTCVSLTSLPALSRAVTLTV